MKPLTYLMLASMKNRLLEVGRSPAKLAAYAVAVGLVAFFSIYFLAATRVNPEPASPVYLKWIFFGFFIISFLQAAAAGLKGQTMYGMHDANLLFTAPVRPRTILLYGALQALKTVLFGSWLIFLQAGWLRGTFGVDGAGLAMLWLGYVAFAFGAEIFRIFLFAFTHGSRSGKRLAVGLIVLALAPLLAHAYAALARADFRLAELLALTGTRAVELTPFAGWAAAGTAALATGELGAGAFFIGLFLLPAALMFAAVFIKEPEYYEQSVASAQATAQAVADVAGGDFQSSLGRKGAKVGATGLWGAGASAFFGKHWRESLRAGRFGLWGFPTIALAAMAGAIALFARADSPSMLGQNAAASLAALMFLKFMISSLSRGVLETYSHYIYLVPEKPFPKWLFANAEATAKALGEGALAFFAVWLATRESPAALAVFALLYACFAFYMFGINLAFMRFTGIIVRVPALALLFFALYLVPAAPGALVGAFAASLVPEEWALAAFAAAMAAWLAAVGAALFAMSKGTLHNCDIPSAMLEGIERNLLGGGR